MQNLLVGAPGSGKSYEAVVYHLLPSLQEGRLVITNLPLKLDAIKALDLRYLDLIVLAHKPDSFSKIGDYGHSWRHPTTGAGPLYIIDESHKALPRSGANRDVVNWFSEHRHESADVLLITQAFSKIDRHILENTQVIYRVRKNIALGSSRSYTRKVQDGYKGEVVNTTVRIYDKKYFPLYESHTKGGGQELAVKDVKPIWRHWSIYCFAACLLYLLFNWKNPLSVLQGANYVKPAPAAPVSDTVALVQSQPGRSAVVASSPVLAAARSASFSATAPANVVSEPFAFVHVHVIGFIRSVDGKRFVYSLLLSRDLNPLRVISSDSLKMAGYKIEALSDCVMRFQWPDGPIRYAICDSPKEVSREQDQQFSQHAALAQTASGGGPARGGVPAGRPAEAAFAMTPSRSF